MEIIGLTGKAGAGKDFIAKRVLRPLGYQNVAFAWALKLEAMRNGFTFEDAFVAKPPAARKWLQEYGVACRENIDVDYWVKQTANLITVLNREGGVEKFVITDVRFPNEVEFVKRLGGKVVRVLHGDRPYPLAGTPFADHESETALDDYVAFDGLIVNGPDQTPKSLKLQLQWAKVIPTPEPKDDPAQLELLTTVGRCLL